MSGAAGRSLFSAGGAFSGQCAVPFSAFQKRQLALILAVGVLLLTAQCTSAAITRSTISSVNLRACASTTCTSYVVIPGRTSLVLRCKKSGQSVSGNPWWLYTSTVAYSGYVSDQYIDCGGYCPLPVC